MSHRSTERNSVLNPLFPRFLKALLGPCIRWGYSVRTEGGQRIPAEGPVIVAANHCSYVDPAFLLTVCPRHIRFFVLYSIDEMKAIHWLFHLYGAIPVQGHATRSALIRGEEALREGHMLGIFPEGQRSFDGTVGKGHPGAVLLAGRTGSPILPAAIDGSYQAMPRWSKRLRRSKVTVRFGKLRYYSQDMLGHRGAMLAETEGLMEEISRLLNETPACHE